MRSEDQIVRNVFIICESVDEEHDGAFSQHLWSLDQKQECGANVAEGH